MNAIGLDGFDAIFAADGDPWRTFTNRDEARKRRAIVTALGPDTAGRMLEIAAGNGSNSVALVRRALRLDATEGTAAGTALVGAALRDRPRACVQQLVLPAKFPRTTYDAIVVAELLYYLDAQALTAVARDVGRALRGGGRLVLAHHRIDFHDFAQRAAGIHERFLHATGRDWRAGRTVRTQRWIVTGYRS